MVECSEEYERIKRMAQEWPDWKKVYYNNNIAISAHSKKLEIKGDISMIKCDMCSKKDVCKFSDAMLSAEKQILILAAKQGQEEGVSQILDLNIFCRAFLEKVYTIRTQDTITTSSNRTTIAGPGVFR